MSREQNKTEKTLFDKKDRQRRPKDLSRIFYGESSFNPEFKSELFQQLYTSTQSLKDGIKSTSSKVKSVFPWTKNKSKLISKITQSVENGNFESIDAKNILFLSADNLEKLNEKQLHNLANVLSKITKLDDDYKLVTKKYENSPYLSSLQNEYDKAFECYKSVLTEVGSYVTQNNGVSNFDVSNYAKTIDELGLTSSRELDLEIVRAFEYLGTSLKFENGKWQIDEKKTSTNKNGYFYTSSNGTIVRPRIQEQYINNFLDNYLNNKDRKHTYTAESIFDFFIDSMRPDTKGLSREDRNLLIEEYEKLKVNYSIDNPDWQSFRIANDRLARDDAKRIALAQIFQNFMPENLHQNIFSLETDNEITLNSRVDGGVIDKFADSMQEQMFDSSEFDILPKTSEIANKYLDTIDGIKTKIQNSNNHEEKNKLEQRLIEVEKAYYTLDLMSQFQTQIVQKALEQEDNKKLSADDKLSVIKKVVTDIGACEFISVSKNNAGIWELSVNSELIPNSLKMDNIQAVVNDINKSLEAKKQSNNNTSNTKEEEPSILFDIDQNISKISNVDILNECLKLTNASGEYILGDVFEQYAVYDRTKFLYENCKPFAESINTFKQNNPNASIDDLIKHLESQGIDCNNPFFTGDSLKMVLASEQSQDAKDRANLISNAQVRSVIIQRITDEINNNNDYIEIIKGDDAQNKLDLLKRLYSEKSIEINNGTQSINDDQIKSSQSILDEYLALSAYGHLLSKSPESGKSELEEFEELIKNETDENKKILTSQVSEAIKKYAGQTLSKVEKKQTTRDTQSSQLSDNSQTQEPVIEEPTLNQIQMKFSEKYPKFDEQGLLNKFKPYCAKSTGKIIDNLIKIIDNTMITFNLETPTSNSSLNSTRNSTNEGNPQENGNISEEQSSKKDSLGEELQKSDEKSTEQPKEQPDEKSDVKQSGTSDNDKTKPTQNQNRVLIKIDENTSLDEKKGMAGLALLAGLYKHILENSSQTLNLDENSQKRLGSFQRILEYLVTEPENGNQLPEEVQLKKELKSHILSSAQKQNKPHNIMEGKAQMLTTRFESILKENNFLSSEDIENVIGDTFGTELTNALWPVVDIEQNINLKIGNNLSDELASQILACKTIDEIQLTFNDKDKLGYSFLENAYNSVISNQHIREYALQLEKQQLEKQQLEERSKNIKKVEIFNTYNNSNNEQLAKQARIREISEEEKKKLEQLKDLADQKKILQNNIDELSQRNQFLEDQILGKNFDNSITHDNEGM